MLSAEMGKSWQSNRCGGSSCDKMEGMDYARKPRQQDGARTSWVRGATTIDHHHRHHQSQSVPRVVVVVKEEEEPSLLKLSRIAMVEKLKQKMPWIEGFSRTPLARGLWTPTSEAPRTCVQQERG